MCVCPVGFTVVCSALGTQGSEAIFSSELVGVTGGPASGEGLQNSLSYDDEIDEDVSGGDHFNPHGKTTKKPLFFLTIIVFYTLMLVNLGWNSYVTINWINKSVISKSVFYSTMEKCSNKTGWNWTVSSSQKSFRTLFLKKCSEWCMLFLFLDLDLKYMHYFAFSLVKTLKQDCCQLKDDIKILRRFLIFVFA